MMNHEIPEILEKGGWAGTVEELGSQQPGPHRIQMHIITGGAQVTCPVALDDDGLVTPAKDMAKELLEVIEPNRVAAQKPAHAGDNIRVGRLSHQVKMVAHQAIGMHLETGLLDPRSEGFDTLRDLLHAKHEKSLWTRMHNQCNLM